MLANKNTTYNANETPVSIPTVFTPTSENAERQSAKMYSAWLRSQIQTLQAELATVELFLRQKTDDVVLTDSADE